MELAPENINPYIIIDRFFNEKLHRFLFLQREKTERRCKVCYGYGYGSGGRSLAVQLAIATRWEMFAQLTKPFTVDFLFQFTNQVSVRFSFSWRVCALSGSGSDGPVGQTNSGFMSVLGRC